MKRNDTTITHFQDYNYLGVIFDSSGADKGEIERRITITKKIISCLNDFIWNKNVTKKRKLIIYETQVKKEPIIRI